MSFHSIHSGPELIEFYPPCFFYLPCPLNDLNNGIEAVLVEISASSQMWTQDGGRDGDGEPIVKEISD